MKKLITIILILALALPALALAEEPDPIVGVWYVMFDYATYPGSADQTGGRSYMIYIMKFDTDGSISAVSTEAMQTGTFQSQGSKVGTWEKGENGYTLNVMGMGRNKAELSDGTLLVQVMENAWYVMRPMVIADWYTDLIIRQ